MGFLKSKQRSTNMEQPFVNDTFKPVATNLLAQGQGGLSNYMNILNGTDNGAGFETYKDSTGYENIFNEAMRGVTGSAAARGLMASGSTARALQDRAGQLGKQNFSNYLQQILQGSQTSLQGGLNAGGVVADVGAQSKRTGGWKEILGNVGQVAQGVGQAASFFSDPRLKTDVELLDVEDDGLGIYAFRYLGEDGTTIGVMADEVAELRPAALGPVVDGYATVDYGAL